MPGKRKIDPTDPNRQDDRDPPPRAVFFVDRPHVTIDSEGAHVSFAITNRGPVSVDVGFDVKIDGKTVLIEGEHLSLGASSGNQSVSLDLPLDTELGGSPKVTVSVQAAHGETLAVGTSGLAITSAPVLIGGVLALTAAAGIGFWALDDEPELGSGDVQVTLEWSEPVDLDLHVVDPAGDEIFHGDTTSSSGGLLDVDTCVRACGEGQHVENIFWPDGEAPVGEYRVLVNYYRGDVPSEYELTIKVEGQPDRRISGELEPDTEPRQYDFSR